MDLRGIVPLPLLAATILLLRFAPALALLLGACAHYAPKPLPDSAAVLAESNPTILSVEAQLRFPFLLVGPATGAHEDPVQTARGDRLVSALILSRYMLLRSQALAGLPDSHPLSRRGELLESSNGAVRNRYLACTEDMMLSATASHLLVEVGYREGRSDIAQGPGAAIGDRLIVGDAVTRPS